MNKVIVFVPKAELDAENNLNNFITMGREHLTVFGADLPFDENKWDITDTIKTKGHGNKKFRVTFSNQKTVNRKKPDYMAEPFLSFAKADFRYSFSMCPTKSPDRRLAALRALECALGEHGESPNPNRATAETFNRASQIVKEHFSEKKAYSVGRQLEALAQFISENRISTIPIDWKTPLKRPKDTTRVGQKYDERRNSKLPSDAALEALPKIFQMAIEPLDVLVSSLTAILCADPERINEALLLLEDCEVFETKNGKDIYGIRFPTSKGADPMIKWIVPTMVDVVVQAISKIRVITEEARDVARWYEKNPDKIFIPSHLASLRNQPYLSYEEVGKLLFGVEGDRISGGSWCRTNKIDQVKRNGKCFVKFSDVEQIVLKNLPEDFPYLNQETGVTYSNALIVFFKNDLGEKKTAFSCIITPVSINTINTGLGSRSVHGFKSVFDRFGFTEPDGSSIKVTTHQFRHYLNNLAQAGGMSQLDIAKWSGRKDVSQNAAYDHVSAEDLVVKIRSRLGDDVQMFGPLSELPKRVIIGRDEFARLKIPTAHLTEFGVCIHDYTMSPCQLYADCFSCTEQVCIKGDEERTKTIKAELLSTEENFIIVEQAHLDGDIGAYRWLEHYRAIKSRLSQLCSILDDPLVPIGSVVQLSNLPVISPIDQAVNDRRKIADKPVDSSTSPLSKSSIRDLLLDIHDLNE